MSEPGPKKVHIEEYNPIATGVLRTSDEFVAADPDGELPDVLLSAAPDAEHRRSLAAQPLVIEDDAGTTIGSLNLVQAGERTWIRGATITDVERLNRKYGLAAYVGVIATVHAAGRILESDPQGLSDSAVRVWESLTRRGVAQPVEGQRDVHGNARYVSARPQLNS